MAAGLIVLTLIVTATTTTQPQHPDPCNSIAQTEESFVLCDMWQQDADFWRKVSFTAAEVIERYRETNRRIAFELASAKDALEDCAEMPTPDPIHIEPELFPDWVLPVGIGVLAAFGGFALARAL